MLKQKRSHREDSQKAKKNPQKNKEKTKRKFAILQKQVKAKFPVENADI